MRRYILLLLVISAALWFPQSQSQAASTQLLAESEELGKAVMRSSLTSWEQSLLHPYCPRLSTIWGGVERISEAAGYLTPDSLESSLGNSKGEVTGETLGYMLTASCRPALLEGNPYVNLTKERWPNGKSFEAGLYEEIMQQPGTLTPGQMLYIAIYKCDSDYWLATLTLHNLLKEVAYAARDKENCVLAFDINAPHDTYSHYTVNPQDVLSKLANMRTQGDPHLSDKIGPWYHMFGILFYSGVTTCGESLLLAHTENITRWLGLGSSRDAFKEEVNIWAAHTSEMLNDLVAENPHIQHKYLSTWPADELNEQLAWINAKHGELQVRLQAEQDVVLEGKPHALLAEEHMDYLRAYQRALVSEANKIKAELGSRP